VKNSFLVSGHFADIHTDSVINIRILIYRHAFPVCFALNI